MSKCQKISLALKILNATDASYPNALHFVIELTEDDVTGRSRRKISHDESVVSAGVFYRRRKIDKREIAGRIRMIDRQSRYDDVDLDGNAYVWNGFNPGKIVRISLSRPRKFGFAMSDANAGPLPEFAVKHAFVRAD